MPYEAERDVVGVWRIAAARYPAEVALAQKTGLAWGANTQKKPLPPSENAALLYREVGAGRGESESSKVLNRFMDLRTPTAAQVERARQAVMQCPELRVIHQAVALPHCRFGHRANGPHPELAALRNGARLLYAESLVLAYQGKGPEAVRNLASGFRLAQHAAGEGTLIHWLVAIAVDAITLAGMERILKVRNGEAATATAVVSAVGKQWKPLSLASVLAAETAFLQIEMARAQEAGFYPYLLGGVDEMFSLPGLSREEKAELEQEQRKAKAELERSLSPATRTSKANEKLLMDASTAYMLRWMRQLKAVADQPYPKAHLVFDTFKRDLATPATLPDGPKAIRMIPAGLMGTFAAPVEFKGYSAARAMTLLAGARLLAKPMATSQTMSGWPKDPFDSKPLRYRRGGAGFVVYSVGPDGNFDGGMSGARLTGQTSSLLFRYTSARA
jgi:hypothetical protein